MVAADSRLGEHKGMLVCVFAASGCRNLTRIQYNLGRAMPISSPTIRDLLVFHYECLQGMYFSEYHQVEGGALLFSDAIKDPYYNFLAPEAPVSGTALPATIVEEFVRRDRQPAIYLTPLAMTDGGPPVTDDQVWARDAWLVGDAEPLASVPQSDESLQTFTIDSTRRETYVSTFNAAYSGDDPNDPYGQLDPAYTKSLDASFDVEVPGYQKYYLLATMDEAPVGVAAMFTAGSLAGVYGVGTIPSRRRAGIGSAMMAHLARIAVTDGASHIMLQTEAGSAVQRWYAQLGYHYVFTAPYVPITRDQ